MIKLFTKHQNINLIVKTVGNACNINCEYCFEQAKNVVHESILPKTLKNIFEQMETTCSVVFHGGEPLLVGKSRFSELLNIVREYYPNKIIAVRIQTNGILLDDEWLDLFYSKYADLDIEIAISLDGTEYMNHLRVDYDKNSTFLKVKNAFELLNKRGKKAGMLTVVSKNSLKYYKEYIEFISTIPNLNFVKINALFNIENNLLSKESITPIEYASFIINSSVYYIEMELYKKIAIEPLLSILQKINNKNSKYCNYSCRKCYNYISLYPDGKLGPCDCFSINDFYITNVNENINLEYSIETATKYQSNVVLQNIIDECNDCDIKEFCNGGCISQRYYFRNNIELKNEYCKAKHILYYYFKDFCL